jgi:hypothetical protein
MITLEQFNSFRVEDFKKWLTTELTNKWSQDREISYKACDLRYLGIRFGESHLCVLEDFYGLLSQTAKDSFCGAIEYLLADKKIIGNIRDDLYVISCVVGD